MGMFGAELYLSCRKIAEDDRRWQEAFYFEDAKLFTPHGAYKKKILGVPYTWLYRLAYQNQIREWKKTKEPDKDYVIGELFRECVPHWI